MSLARANAKEQGKGGHLSSDVPVGNVIASLPIVGLSMRDTIHWDFPVMLAGCLAAGKTAFSGTEYDRTGTVEQPQVYTKFKEDGKWIVKSVARKLKVSRKLVEL